MAVQGWTAFQQKAGVIGIQKEHNQERDLDRATGTCLVRFALSPTHAPKN